MEWGSLHGWLNCRNRKEKKRLILPGIELYILCNLHENKGKIITNTFTQWWINSIYSSHIEVQKNPKWKTPVNVHVSSISRKMEFCYLHRFGLLVLHLYPPGLWNPQHRRDVYMMAQKQFPTVLPQLLFLFQWHRWLYLHSKEFSRTYYFSSSNSKHLFVHERKIREKGRAQEMYVLCNFKISEEASYALITGRFAEPLLFAVIWRTDFLLKKWCLPGHYWY